MSWPCSTRGGHDFGGTVALRTLLLHKQRYRCLVLVDPVALAPWGSPFFRLVAEHADVFAQLPTALHRALVTEYVSSASAAGLAPEIMEALIAPWLSPAGQAAFYRQIAQADQSYTDEVQPDYPDVDVPTLICWGTADAWIPVAKARELSVLIPGAELHLVPDAGHLVQFDAPMGLFPAIEGFLTR